MIDGEQRFTQSLKGSKSARPVLDRFGQLESIATAVVDCAFKLHEDLGPGLLESAYETFLAASLREKGLIVGQQRPVAVTYKGVSVRDAFKLDLLVEHVLIVEIKSVEKFAPVHAKQLLTYLRLTELPLGLLLNFGSALLKDGIKRVINERTGFRAQNL